MTFDLTATLSTWPGVLAGALVALLVLGGTLRLTRLVTTDSLGGWLIREPLVAWATPSEVIRRRAIADVIEETAVTADEDDLVADLTLDRWRRAIDGDAPVSFRARLVSGVECPFCVGFWIGAAVLLVTWGALALGGPLLAAWGILLAALTLNYVAGHVSRRLDD